MHAIICMFQWFQNIFLCVMQKKVTPTLNAVVTFHFILEYNVVFVALLGPGSWIERQYCSEEPAVGH